MGSTFALSDNQGALITAIFAVFFSVQASIAGLPDDQKPPAYVMTIIAIIGSAALVIERQLGTRDATTARVAKTVDPKLLQFRKASNTQYPEDMPASDTATPAGPPPSLPPAKP